MSYKLINANNIAFNSDGFITAENIKKMPCIYADLPNGMDGKHYVLEQEPCEWKMIHRKHNEVKQYTGIDLMGNEHTIYVKEQYECDEPYCPKCGKRADNIAQSFCGFCGARIVEKQEISDTNMKMWEEIYAEEDKRRKALEYEKYALEQNMQALK